MKQQHLEDVTFLITDDHDQIDEDSACADYIAALLRDESPDTAALLQPVRDGLPSLLAVARNIVTKRHLPEETCRRFAADLDHCLDVDRFDFAMVAEREGEITKVRSVSV